MKRGYCSLAIDIKNGSTCSSLNLTVLTLSESRWGLVWVLQLA